MYQVDSGLIFSVGYRLHIIAFWFPPFACTPSSSSPGLSFISMQVALLSSNFSWYKTYSKVDCAWEATTTTALSYASMGLQISTRACKNESYWLASFWPVTRMINRIDDDSYSFGIVTNFPAWESTSQLYWSPFASFTWTYPCWRLNSVFPWPALLPAKWWSANSWTCSITKSIMSSFFALSSI